MAGSSSAAVSTSAAAAARSEYNEDLPPWVRSFLAQIGDRDPGSSAKSAMCISRGLLSEQPSHVEIDAHAAVELRASYLEFLSKDALEALVAELVVNPDEDEDTDPMLDNPLMARRAQWAAGSAEDGAVISPRVSGASSSRTRRSRRQPAARGLG